MKELQTLLAKISQKFETKTQMNKEGEPQGQTSLWHNWLVSIMKHKNLALAGVFVFLFAGFFAISSWQASSAQAAIAFDASSESHTGTSGSTNQASFSWTHTPVGTPKGVLIFVWNDGTVAKVTSITYGGVNVPAVNGAAAVDTAGETGRMSAYYLGSGVPTGAQTITVNRVNDATELWAVAITVTGLGDTQVYEPGIVLLQEDQALAVQSVTDGSPGTNSLRFAGTYSGLASPPSAGTGSTLLQNFDSGNFGGSVVRETTAGQGARNVGFTGTSDDVAAVHLAVRETPLITISGTCKAYDQTTNCTNTAGVIKVAVNGVLNSTNTQADESGGGTGNWSISSFPAPATNAIVTIFLDGAAANSDKTVAYVKYSGSGNITGVKLYKETIAIGSAENTTNISDGDINQYDASNNAAILVEGFMSGTCNGVTSFAGLCTDSQGISTQEILYIDGGDTLTMSFSKGLAATKIQVAGTITTAGGTGATYLTGSGTNTSCNGNTSQIPLCISGGTFSYSLLYFIGTSDTIIPAGSYGILNLQPGANNVTFTFGAGTLTTTGGITVGDGTHTGVIIDGSVNNPTVNLNNNSILTIFSNSELKAGSGTWTLSGSGTPFVNSGTFTPNTSTFVYTSPSATTLAPTSYYNLSLTPSSGTPTYDVSPLVWTTYGTFGFSLQSFAYDSTHGILYTGNGTTGIIYRCDTTTNCDAAGDWTTSYDTPESNIGSMFFDSAHGILYAGTNPSAIIYRCDTTTNCDAAGDWTTSYDTPESSIISMTMDTTNGVLYAGTNSGGIIYRCDTTTNCDAAGDWTTSYDTTENQINTLIFDSTHGILYAGSTSSAIIYRCDTTTNCDAAGDWTTSYDTPEGGINGFAYDSTNHVLYAGSNGSAIIYRCDTTTNCDAAGDWTTSYDSTESAINTLIFDSAHGILYAGSSASGLVYRCDTTTNCDAAGDWTTSYDSPSSQYTFSFGYDTANSVLYAGGGNSAYIYRGISSNLSVQNNFTISSSATFSLGPVTLTIGGNFTNNGNFSAGTGTVVFNDNTKTSVLSGTTTTDSSYSETNQDSIDTLNGGGVATSRAGQSFTSAGGVLSEVQFYLSKSNSATTNISAVLYSHSGTFGSTSVPGTILAISDLVSQSNLTGSLQLITFRFSGANRYLMTAGTPYFIALNVPASSAISFGRDASSPSHPGNYASYTGIDGWSASSLYDGIFYVKTGGLGFNNLTVTTAGKNLQFTAGQTFDIGGALTVTGASGNLVHFNSTTGSSVWTINHQGTESITYLDVKWSACDAVSTTIDLGTGSTKDANSGSCWSAPFVGITVSGHAYSGQGSGALASKTIMIQVNGAGSFSGVTDGAGAYSIASVSANTGNVITVYISGATENATTVAVSNGLDVSDMDLYQNTLIVRYATGSSITNTNLDTFDDGNNGSNGDVIYSVTTGNLTLNDGAKLLVWSGKTFAPGGTVTTSPDNGTTTIDGDVEIQSGATLDMAANALSIGGSFVNAGTFSESGSPHITTFTATTTGQTIDLGTGNFENVTLNGSGGGWSFSDASNTISGDLTVTAGTLSGTASLTVDGGDVTGAGTVNLTGGTLTVDGAGSFGSSSDWTFNNLTFSGASQTTAGTGPGSVTVSGVLTIGSGHTFDAAAKTWYLTGSGTPFVATGTFTPSTSSIVYRGSGATNIASSSNGGTSITYYDLEVNGANGITYTLGTASGHTINATTIQVFPASGSTTVTGATYNPTINISGSLSIASGATYVTGTGTLTFSGNGSPLSSPLMREVGAVFTATTGNTVVYTSGTGASALAGLAMTTTNGFYNLTINSSGTFTSGVDIDVNNDLTVTAGTLAGTNNFTVAGAVTGNGSINLTGGTFTHNATTSKNFGGSSSWTFNNLTVSGASGTTTATGAGNITVSGVLTVGLSHTLDAGSKTWNLTATGTPLSISGTFTPSSSTVSYQNITSATVAATTYNNLDFSPASGTPTYTPAIGTVTVNNNLSLNGAGNETVNFDTNDPTLDVNGSVTIGAGDTLIASATGSFTVAGSWTNSGVFTHSNGTVTFDAGSTGKTISANGTSGKFNNVTFNNASGGWTVSSTDMNATGVLTITAGNLNGGSGRTITLEGSGTPFVNNGTFTYGTSIVKYTSSGATNIAAANMANSTGGTNGYYDLQILPGGATAHTLGTAASQTIGVAHNLTVGNGTNAGATGATNNPAVTVAGTMTIAANATYTTGTGTLTFSGSGTPLTRNGAFTATNGNTVAYTSGSGVTALSSAAMSGSFAYYNLTINGSGTFTAGVTVTANGDLTVSAGTLAIGAFDLIVGNQSGGTGNIKVASGQSLTQSSSNTTTILTPNASSSCIGSNGSSCSGTAGAITLGNLTIGQVGITQTTTFGGTNPSMTVVGILTVTTNSIFDAGSGTVTLSKTGGTPFVKNGTFTPSTSTVNYTGGNNTTITAASYNNLGIKPGVASATHNMGSGTFTIAGTLTIGDGTTTGAIVSASSFVPTIDLNGTGTSIDVKANTTFVATTQPFTVAGSWSNAGTFTHNSGTVTFDATTTGKTITSGGSQFNNIVFNGSGGGWSPSDALVLAGDMTMTAGTLSGTQSITVNGGDVTGDGVINMTGGTFLTDGTGSFGGATGWNFSSLTFGDGTGTTTTTSSGSGTITTSSVLTIAANQTLDAGSRTWAFTGNGTPIVRNGTFTANASTVSISAASQNITAVSSAVMTGANAFYNLNMNNGTATYSLGVDVEAKNIAVFGGSTSAGTNNITAAFLRIPATTFTQSASATTTIVNPNGSTGCMGSSGSSCSGAMGNATFGNLVIGNGTDPITVNIGATSGSPNITVSGSLTINANATFNLGSLNPTLNFTGNGTVFTPTGTFTPGNSTMNFVSGGTTGTTIPAASYYNLVVNKCGNSFTASGNITASNDLNIACGTFVAPAGTLTINKTLENYSAFSANGGTVVIAPQAAGSNTVTVAGTQGLTFNNLTNTTAGSTVNFTNGRTYTISGTLTATGSGGNPIWLQSTTPGSQWTVSFASQPSLSFVNVRDSACSGGITIATIQTLFDQGNNGSCWHFIQRGGGVASGGGAGSNGSSASGGSSSGGSGSSGGLGGSGGSSGTLNGANWVELFPTLASNVAGPNGLAWSTPESVKAVGGGTSYNNVYSFATTSDTLYTSGYGFNIDSTAIIQGIQVTVNLTETFNNPFLNVTLSKGSSQQTLPATGDNVFGSSTDLWGASWSPADLSNLTAGVVLSYVISSPGDATIDYIKVKVYYTLSSGGGGGNPSP